MTTGLESISLVCQTDVMGMNAATWTKAGENLVRHSAGTYYLRAKVAGKPIRESLGVSDLKLAKIKRDARMTELKAEAAARVGSSVTTVREVVILVEKKILDRPNIKPRTVAYYKEMLATLRESLPLDVNGSIWNEQTAREWWKKQAKKLSPQRANNLLMLAKHMGKALVKAGLQKEDPTENLRRVRIPIKELRMPSREQMDQIIESVRSMAKANSEESANKIAFLAYSGMRSGEIKALEWNHIGEKWLTVTGGESGTKNSEIRQVPISGPLQVIIERMDHKGAKGKVFFVRDIHQALTNACARLELPHMRVHDLRHFFATWCIHSGVDIPTVAKWLGHKDKGALVMRVYGHVRDDHSLKAVERLK